MKKSKHMDSKSTWWLWLGMCAFLVMWGLSGCPSPKPGQETQEEPGLELTKEAKKEPVLPDAVEPGKEPDMREPGAELSQEDGKEPHSDAKDAADTPEPVSEPMPEPEPVDRLDGGPDSFDGGDSVGDGGGEDSFENVPEEPTTEFVPKDDICGGRRPCVTTYAGQPWDKEGPALADWFTAPTVIASDGKDTIYIWDKKRYKIFAYDVKTKRVKLIAGNGIVGEKDGPALQVPLGYICGMTVSPQGLLYMGSNNNVRKIDAKGNIVEVKGGFLRVCGIAFDSKGLLYIADEAKIYTYDEKTKQLSTYAGTGILGYKNGPRLQAQFNYPKNLAFDSKGVLYVSERSSNIIRKVDTSGNVGLVFGINPSVGSKSNDAGMAIDKSDNIYLVSSNSDEIRVLTPNGNRTLVTGGSNGYTDGPFTTAQFWLPAGIAFDANGKLYVADEGNKRLRMLDFSAKTVSTVMGGTVRGADDGPADWASFGTIRSITLDPQGTLYISDYGNNNIRKVDANRTVSTVGCQWNRTIASDKKGVLFASGGYSLYRFVLHPVCSDSPYVGLKKPGHLDGPFSIATFTDTYGMLFDADKIYVNDVDRVRVIDTVKKTVSTLGIGPHGSSSLFQGIAKDSKGNIFVADGKQGYIAKFTPNGIHSVFAGSPGKHDYVDAKGTNARFQYPRAIAIDNQDNIYVIDNYLHLIRKIDSQGNVTTFAGKEEKGFANGWGTQAMFNYPHDLVFDGKNALYVSDEFNYRVRKILLR